MTPGTVFSPESVQSDAFNRGTDQWARHGFVNQIKSRYSGKAPTKSQHYQLGTGITLKLAGSKKNRHNQTVQ